MLTIRLSRVGKKKQPSYRIVVQDKRRDPWSPAIEVIGHFNPLTEPATVTLEEERVKHWLAMGAQPSGTVGNMLIDKGFIKAEKTKNSHISKTRAAKLAEAKAKEEPKSDVAA